METLHSFVILFSVWIFIPFCVQVLSAIILRTDLRASLLLARIFSAGSNPRTTLIGQTRRISAFSLWIARRLEHVLYLLRQNLKLIISKIEQEEEKSELESRRMTELQEEVPRRKLTFSYQNRYKDFTPKFISSPAGSINLIRSALLGPVSDFADALVFVMNTVFVFAYAAVVVILAKYSMSDFFAEIEATFSAMSTNFTSLSSLDSVVNYGSGLFDAAKDVITNFSFPEGLLVLAFALAAFFAFPICSHPYISEINFKFWHFYPRLAARVFTNAYSLFLCTSIIEFLITVFASAETYASCFSLFVRFGLYFDLVLIFELMVLALVAVIFNTVVRPIGFMISKSFGRGYSREALNQ